MPETKTIAVVSPFTIEIDLPTNGHIIIQSIPGRAKLRSRFLSNRSHPRGGNSLDADDMVVSKDFAGSFSDHPEQPGQMIHVDPGDGTYEITDPCYGAKTITQKIERWLARHNVLGNNKNLDGFPPKKGRLDQHRMKTLCRELCHVLELGHARIKDGPIPRIEDVDDLPGHYLLNPGATVRNGQPKFEKDLAAWEEKLNAMGG